MNGSAPLVSVVCPVFNEEDCLAEFYARATTALEAISPPVRHELLFVNDGSSDSSIAILQKLCQVDRRVRLLDLSRNFGHQVAITAGIDRATGDAVVVIDADLQDPPDVIAEMVARWREGYKVVYGVRAHRPGETRLKLFTAKAFYRLINRLSDTPLPVDAGDFRLMDAQVVGALRSIREENRYIRGLVSWVGFSQCALPYERDPRYAGETKFGLRRMIRFAVDGITSFSERPLRLAMQVGLMTTLVTFALGAWIVGNKVLSPDNSIPGYASLMVVVLFFGGVQLLSLGLLGEYVGRIYRESKQRPLYIVAEEINLDGDKTP